MDRIQPWQRLGLKPHEEEFARLRVSRPELSGIAIVKLITAYSGRSKSAQSNVAHNLLKRLAIQQRLQQLQREAIRHVERKRRHKLTAKNVLKELVAIGMTDLRELVTVAGDRVTIRDSADWPDEAAKAVASVTNSPDGPRLQLYDKPTALARLARVLRLIPEEAQPGGIAIGKALIYIPHNNRPMLNPGDDPDDFADDPNPNQEEFPR